MTEILRPLPFELFPHLFPALFAVWVFDEGMFAPDEDDDPWADEQHGADADPWADEQHGADADGADPSAPAPTDSKPRPLSARSLRTLPALFRLLDTRPVGDIPQLLTDPWQISAILDGLLSPRVTYDDLENVGILRDHLHRAVTAPDLLDAHDLLNELALRHAVTAHLAGDGELTHVTAFPDAASAVAAVTVPTVMELHARGWAGRVRGCAAASCWTLFLDRSSAGTARYCSTKCAARERGRRRRERGRGPGTETTTPGSQSPDGRQHNIARP